MWQGRLLAINLWQCRQRLLACFTSWFWSKKNVNYHGSWPAICFLHKQATYGTATLLHPPICGSIVLNANVGIASLMEWNVPQNLQNCNSFKALIRCCFKISILFSLFLDPIRIHSSIISFEWVYHKSMLVNLPLFSLLVVWNIAISIAFTIIIFFAKRTNVFLIEHIKI